MSSSKAKNKIMPDESITNRPVNENVCIAMLVISLL